MKNRINFPRRGEIWLVNFNPARGSEQKGIRPALILQNNSGNENSSTTIVAAITTTIKIYPITVFLSGSSNGLEKDSMANLAQLLTVDKTRLMKKLGELNFQQQAKINHALKISLDLE